MIHLDFTFIYGGKGDACPVVTALFVEINYLPPLALLSKMN
jgi:hypothetical protein